MDVRSLQDEHRAWLQHNFPNQDPNDALLGVVEEVGEFAHAVLKRKQGIRTVNDNAVRDAIGDIFIYLMSYCNTNNLSLAECIEDAWLQVSERDWVAYPKTGRPAA